MTKAVLTRDEVGLLMGSVVRRYRRGEITEKEANRETAMLKALVETMEKGGAPPEPLPYERLRAQVVEVVKRLVMRDADFREKIRAALKEAGK